MTGPELAGDAEVAEGVTSRARQALIDGCPHCGADLAVVAGELRCAENAEHQVSLDCSGT